MRVDQIVAVTAKYGVNRNAKYSTESSSSARTHSHSHSLSHYTVLADSGIVTLCDLIGVICVDGNGNIDDKEPEGGVAELTTPSHI